MRRVAGVRSWRSWRALAALTLAFAPQSALAVERAAPASATEFVPNEVLIKLGPGVDARALDAALAKHTVKRLRRLFRNLEDGQGALRTRAAQRAAASRQRFAARTRRAHTQRAAPDLENLYVLELEGAVDVRAEADQLASLPGVVYAEPNWIYRSMATPLPVLPFVPDDRFVTLDRIHWSEGAWAQDFLDLWGLRKIRALEAWNAFDANGDGAFGPGETKPGEGVVVAVIDSGIDSTHPDIAANLWTNAGEIPDNGVDDDANGFVDDWRGWSFASDSNDPDDLYGHGSHVAGTIAAAAGDGAGIAGVAPWARVMAVAALRQNGSATATDLARAVIYAAENGADILSNSWGGPESGAIRDAFAFAESVGALAVASAGNSSTSAYATSPANLPSVIGVAALEPDDERASFSNFAEGVDIAAPGTGILSLNAHGGSNIIATEQPGRVVEIDYLWLNGTSMAAPHVAGALAVLMSRFPGASQDELLGRLRAGARDIDALNPTYAGRLGSGALDLEASIVAAPRPVVEIAGTSPPILPIGGGRVSLVVQLRNHWKEAEDAVVSLASRNRNLRIVDGTASLGDLPTAGTRSNESDPFRLLLARDIPVGSNVELELRIEAAGYSRTLPLRLKASLFEDATAGSGLPSSEFVSLHVLFDDYSGDRLPDLALIGFFTWKLLENLGGGRFADAVATTGIVPPGARESLFADMDGDGDRDVVLGGAGSTSIPSQLFENLGSLPFVDRSVGSGIRDKPMGSLVALDYDRDGGLDIAGGRNQLVLLRNNRDGSFTDVTTAANFRFGFPLTMTQDLHAFDYDDDGDQDVAGFAVNGGFFLFRNEGNGTFVHQPDSTLGIDERSGGRAIATGDYDNDGDLDLFLTGLGGTLDRNRSALYRNEGDGRFTNVTALSGDLALGTASGWDGPAFFDFDNDADLDLYLDAEGIPNEVTDHLLYRNDGAGGFTIVNEMAFPPGFAPGGGVGAIADYDRDGSLDLYALDGNFGGTGRGGLLRNRVGALHHSIQIDLRGRPFEPFGARVRVVAGGVSQIRELHSASHESLPLHFGLRDATTIDRIEIRWPDGRLQRIADVAADQVLEVVEHGVFCTGSVDGDADGVPDTCDSCPGVANATQDDADADGEGDACNGAADADGDEWSDALDVCPSVPDPGQADANGDGMGDACPAAVSALPAIGWLALAAGIAAVAARRPRASR